MNNAQRQTNPEQLATSGLQWLKALGNTVVDLLFPPRCVACQRLGSWLCSFCLDEIETIPPPVCRLCGLPLDDQAMACERCQKAPPQLDGLRAYGFYGGPLREAIHKLKYDDLRALAAPLGNLMANAWASLAPPEQGIDAVVPVPLHATRQRQRGYNQAALLAREMCARLQWPVVEDVLIRARVTAPQVELGIQERRANVRDAFRCVSDRLSGKRVLLVDDVCTTGSTLEAACEALREGGASLIWAYTLARAREQERSSLS